MATRKTVRDKRQQEMDAQRKRWAPNQTPDQLIASAIAQSEFIQRRKEMEDAAQAEVERLRAKLQDDLLRLADEIRRRYGVDG